MSLIWKKRRILRSETVHQIVETAHGMETEPNLFVMWTVR